QAAHGSVVLNADGTVTYTPAANFNGSDTFTYTISDGHGATATGTVSITVKPVNDAPVAADDSTVTDEDTDVTFAVLANATDRDADGDTLAVTAVTPGTHGSTAINPNGSVTYTPAAGYSGGDSFTYTVSDGHGGTATASVAITVNSVSSGNHPPEITSGDLTL